MRERAWGIPLLLLLLGCPDTNFRSAKMTNADQALPPGTPVISGPATLRLGATAFFSLASTDPRGLALTFETPTPGCVIEGQALRFTPAEAGTVTIRVLARNSAGLTSPAGEWTVKVEPA